jgi:hypothetical protein
LGQHLLWLLDSSRRSLERALKTLCSKIRRSFKRRDFADEGLPAVVKHLHKGTHTDGRKKRDDEDRDRPAQQGLSSQ